MEKGEFVDILASGRAATLYVGVTSRLEQRLYQHRSGLLPGFTARYGLKLLVWFERHDDITEAIRREKQIKKWRREWKLNLIEAENPEWIDLATELGFEAIRSANGPPPSRG